MKKLYLHIGTGKTGSTSIQKYLEKYSLLEKCKFHFQYDMNGATAIKNINAFIARMNKVDSTFALYSNEWLCNANAEFIQKLQLKLSKVFDVHIIIYIRRQDRFMVSRYQQASKNWKMKSEHGPVALPLDYKKNIDYFNTINNWANAFGKNKVITRVFDKNKLLGKDVVVDFLDIIGVKRDLTIEPKRVNESIGFEKNKIGHLLNMSGLRLEKPKIANAIFRHADSEGKLLPCRQDVLNFYNQYKGSNIKLNEQYNICPDHQDIFDNDFSFYPEERADLWDEESANQAILNIFKAIKKMN